jgi:hypothetical protein
MNNLTSEQQAYFENVVTQMENDLIAATDNAQMHYQRREQIRENVRQGTENTLRWFSHAAGNAPTANDRWSANFISQRHKSTSLYKIGEQFPNLSPLTERLLNIHHASAPSQSHARIRALVKVREIVKARVEAWNAQFNRGNGSSRRADAGQVMHGPDARAAQVESSQPVASSSLRSHLSPAPSHASREAGGSASPYADTPAGRRAASLTASSRRASQRPESEGEGFGTDSGGSSEERRERQSPKLRKANFEDWNKQSFSRRGPHH